MSNQLYMDVQAANAVVQEIKSYKSEVISGHFNFISQPYLNLSDGRTWVAGSFKAFANALLEIMDTHRIQDRELEDLITALEKEVREWEETSSHLGS